MDARLYEVVDPVVAVLSDAEGDTLRRVAELGEGQLVLYLTEIKENHSDPDAVTKATEALAELQG